MTTIIIAVVTGVVGLMVGGTLGLLVGAALGARRREQLEETIAWYESTLELPAEGRPAAEQTPNRTTGDAFGRKEGR
jgi:hypothetical protein